MTADKLEVAQSDREAADEGPLPDEYHLRELPGRNWLTCHGCNALRVFDWHYFYCRRLGDQSKPDAWNAGWMRLYHGTTYKDAAPCNLPVRAIREPSHAE